LYTKSHFFRTPPLLSQNLGVFSWSRPVLFGSAESEHPELTNREIIFGEFHPMWPRYVNVTERQTDDLPWQYRALRCIAW